MKIKLKESIFIYFGSIMIELNQENLQQWEWNEGSRRVFIDLNLNNVSNMYFDLSTNTLKYKASVNLGLGMRNALRILEKELREKLVIEN